MLTKTHQESAKYEPMYHKVAIISFINLAHNSKFSGLIFFNELENLQTLDQSLEVSPEDFFPKFYVLKNYIDLNQVSTI